MSITLQDGVIVMSGDCGVEDVEALVNALEQSGLNSVDLTEVLHLHGAVLQILLSFKPSILGSPRDSFVRTWLIPILKGRGASPLRPNDTAEL
jgi:hypothetical protein